jgi:hypothetical protein
MAEPDGEMEKFFNHIIEVTSHSSDQVLIKRTSDELINVLTRDFKRNIKIAADRGHNQAYICIYEVDAKYRDILPIDKFIHMNDHMRGKFAEFGLEPVVDRLRKIFQPFQLDIQRSSVASSSEEIPDMQIVILSLSWPSRKMKPAAVVVPAPPAAPTPQGPLINFDT